MVTFDAERRSVFWKKTKCISYVRELIRMEVVNINLSNIKPYQRNPRNNAKAVEKVAESIRQFGFQQPLVLDRDNVIVCGHTRYAAAKKLMFTSADKE